MADFYTKNKIDININLIKIEHGTVNDTPYKTLPLFHQNSDRLQTDFEHHNKILVNCNNGRSRSAAVIALYLMKHLNFNVDDALAVVHKALEMRGFENYRIDDEKGINGSYGDWLKKYGIEIPDKNLLIREPKNFLRSEKNNKLTLFHSPIKAKAIPDKPHAIKFRSKREILHAPLRVSNK